MMNFRYILHTLGLSKKQTELDTIMCECSTLISNNQEPIIQMGGTRPIAPDD